MKPLDRYLQRRRIATAMPWIRDAESLLDIGCADASLFAAAPWLTRGLGIDPDVTPSSTAGMELRQGMFPEAMNAGEQFDVATVLAVFEHVPPGGQQPFLAGLRTALVPGGVVVLTIPSPLVDKLLHVLTFLRLVDGMHAHEHWGFDVRQTRGLFETAGFEQVRHRAFQFGLNNLFVFRAPR